MQLELTSIRKEFAGHPALNDISLALDDFHALAVIGPSGGGKSTLLRVLAGLEIPDKGRVTLNGSPLIFREEELLQHRRSVGTVFQAFNLFPHLTALGNILLPLEKAHGLRRDEARDCAMELLTRFQLQSHAGKVPAQLSGGQQQRVAIARAIAGKPRFLLFDEPTSALDPEMTAEVLDIIAELRRDGRDLILVTHEMGFARQVADQCIFVADGEIIERGPTARLFEAPEHPVVRNFFARVLRY